MGRRAREKRKKPLLSSKSSQDDPPDKPSNLTQQQQLFSRAVESFSVRGEHFSGPLPPPEMLRKYDEIFPGLAERIITMAETQSRHRQGLEKTVVEGRMLLEGRAQTMAFVLAFVIAAGSIFLIATGKSIIGLSALITEVVALTGVFIYGRRRQEKELAEKRRALIPG